MIHNCCGETYRRALSCLLPNEELFFLPIRDVLNEKAEVAEFTYIIGRKDVEEKCREQSPSSIFLTLPNFYFDGYHPDACYVYNNNNEQVNSPVGPYNSLIAVSAFKADLSLEETLSLYCEKRMKIVIFSSNMRGVRILIDPLQSKNSIRDSFRQWSKKGCFMHSFNHPQVGCLVDIAKKFAELHFGLDKDFPIVLPDQLAASAILPCYPKIADRRGTSGSFMFKLPSEYRYIDLPTFLSGSFKQYEQLGKDNFRVASQWKDRQGVIMSYVLGEG